MSSFSLKKLNFNSTSPIDYVVCQSYNGNQVNKSLLKQRLQNAKTLYGRDLFAHYGCVNAVEFSNDGEYLVSGGDDKRVLLWNINKALSYNYRPKSMKGEHHSNIFCLSLDAKHTRIFSAGNDEQVILHDAETGETSDVFLHDEAVYGLSVDPTNENIFASACEDGRVLIWDTRKSVADAVTLASYSSGFHAVTYNPAEPNFIATANAKEGVGLWDIRKPKCCLMKYGTHYYSQGAMSVCFNKIGRSILALRRRLPPVLYEISSPRAAIEFDHPEYYNSCTMKSCCFAGDRDQFVLSGSDDFKLYMWKVPDDIVNKKSQWANEAQLTIRGHRSIVNQVRYNNTYGIFASSGVEKVIKLWSTFPISGNLETTYLKNALRKVYTHEEYLNLVLESGQFMTHDYSHHSVQEDPRMMAFFDSLVQRDIEGWSSSDSSTDLIDGLNTNYEVVSSHSSSTSTCSSSESENEESIKNGKSVTNRELRKFDDSNESTDEQNLKKEDFLSDRISYLIAKKRKHQLHSTVLHKSNKMRKYTKKSHKKRRKGTNTPKSIRLLKSSFYMPNIETVQGILSHASANSNVNDKRKTLQKKRAKILRLPDISDHSSDSDIPDEKKNPITTVKNGETSDNVSTSGVNSKLEHNKISEEISTTTVLNSVDETNESKEVTKSDKSKNHESKEIAKSDKSKNHNVPNLSSEFNGSSSSIETNGSLFLQPKTKKHHSRNYRKRSSDDIQEDS